MKISIHYRLPRIIHQWIKKKWNVRHAHCHAFVTRSFSCCASTKQTTDNALACFSLAPQSVKTPFSLYGAEIPCGCWMDTTRRMKDVWWHLSTRRRITRGQKNESWFRLAKGILEGLIFLSILRVRVTLTFIRVIVSASSTWMFIYYTYSFMRTKISLTPMTITLRMFWCFALMPYLLYCAIYCHSSHIISVSVGINKYISIIKTWEREVRRWPQSFQRRVGKFNAHCLTFVPPFAWYSVNSWKFVHLYNPDYLPYEVLA